MAYTVHVYAVLSPYPSHHMLYTNQFTESVLQVTGVQLPEVHMAKPE